MFTRAAEELGKLDNGAPFYALLQTLSNHTSYALPEQLPVAAVEGHGALDQHLTAMRYSDWALGQFFDNVRNPPWFTQTSFVVVGDNGFGASEGFTVMDSFRLHVTMLMIVPGVPVLFGNSPEVG